MRLAPVLVLHLPEVSLLPPHLPPLKASTNLWVLERNARTTTRSQSSFTPSRQSRVVESDTSTDDDDEQLVSRGKHHDYLEIGEAETSNDERMHSSPIKKARTNKVAKEEPIIEFSDDSEDDKPVSVEPRRIRRAFIVENTDDDESDEVLAPLSTPRKRTRDDVQREEAELAEDLENLRSSPIRMSPIQTKASSRQSALEKLKSRRASLQNPSSSRAHRNVIVDSDDEVANEFRPSFLAVNALDLDEPFEVSDTNEDGDGDEQHETTAREIFSENENDQEFLASDDEDDELGVPVELPFEFSALARMKTNQAFEIVVEWMVQKKINPAFDRDAPKYVTAFGRVEDEAKILVGSKFVSSVWKPGFTTALYARPEISVWEEDHALHVNCEACNRTNHPATFKIRFSGKPYEARTLEELEQDSDEDDSDDVDNDDDDDDATAEQGEIYDSNGALVAPASRVFSLGRFCMANAKTAHTLHHWKIHLMSWVVDHLRVKMGELTADKIVERDGWKDSRRRKDADRIVAEMARDGTIKSLYSEYKDEIDEARNAKVCLD